MAKGWENESARHSLARYGIKTGTNKSNVPKSKSKVLIPKTITQKSFGGKAVVRAEDGKIILKSYATDVAYIDKNGKAVVKGLYSATTRKHIMEFLRQRGFKAESSEQVMRDYGKDTKNAKVKIPTKSNWVSTDGWRGHEEFPNSVYETWATGEYEDAGENAGSKVDARLKVVQKVLRDEGINSKVKTTQTSNVFSTGVDVLVTPNDMKRAKEILKKKGF